jgi:hypothetical protein
VASVAAAAAAGVELVGVAEGASGFLDLGCGGIYVNDALELCRSTRSLLNRALSFSVPRCGTGRAMPDSCMATRAF